MIYVQLHVVQIKQGDMSFLATIFVWKLGRCVQQVD